MRSFRNIYKKSEMKANEQIHRKKSAFVFRNLFIWTFRLCTTRFTEHLHWSMDSYYDISQFAMLFPSESLQMKEGSSAMFKMFMDSRFSCCCVALLKFVCLCVFTSVHAYLCVSVSNFFCILLLLLCTDLNIREKYSWNQFVWSGAYSYRFTSSCSFWLIFKHLLRYGHYLGRLIFWKSVEQEEKYIFDGRVLRATCLEYDDKLRANIC